MFWWAYYQTSHLTRIFSKFDRDLQKKKKKKLLLVVLQNKQEIDN